MDYNSVIFWGSLFLEIVHSYGLAIIIVLGNRCVLAIDCAWKVAVYWLLIVRGNRCALAWQGYGLHLYSLDNAC